MNVCGFDFAIVCSAVKCLKNLGLSSSHDFLTSRPFPLPVPAFLHMLARVLKDVSYSDTDSLQLIPAKDLKETTNLKDGMGLALM